MKTHTTRTATTAARPSVSTDIYHLYLREIGPIPLLTREEETALGRRARTGDTAARELLIKSNLRLVVKIARDYETSGIPLLDLVAEGNIGLMTAVDRFDPERGAKLSVYASFWIKQSVRRAIANQSRTVRLPVYLHQRMFDLNRVTHRLRETLGHEPTEDDLAHETGLPLRSVTRLHQAAQRSLSLDESISRDSDDTLSEIIPDEAAHTPADHLDRFQLEALIGDLMSELTPRETLILRHRFGLGAAGRLTLEEIADQLKLTRERIRQLQNTALVKLRKKLAASEPGWA